MLKNEVFSNFKLFSFLTQLTSGISKSMHVTYLFLNNQLNNLWAMYVFYLKISESINITLVFLMNVIGIFTM